MWWRRMTRLVCGRSLVTLTATVVLALTVASCHGTGRGAPSDQQQALEAASDVAREGSLADTSIVAAQEELTATVIGLPGVVGTGIGLCDGEPCIQVFLAQADRELESEIPRTYRGFAVDIVITGELRARPDTTQSR